MNLSSFLLSKFDCIETSNESEFRATCPFCHHRKKKFYFYLTISAYKCYHCGKRGRLEYLIRSLFPNTDMSNFSFAASPTAYTRKTEGIPLPKDFQSYRIRLTSQMYVDGITYLLGRGISMKTIQEFNLGWSPSYSYQVIFPVYSVDNVQVYYTTRYFKSGISDNKYYNPVVPGASKFGKGSVVYNLNKVITRPHIYICEGPFDMLSLWTLGYTSVATLGKSITPEQVALLKRGNFTRITICLDADAEKDSYAMASTLTKHLSSDIFICKFDENNDPNDALLNCSLPRVINTATRFSKLANIMRVTRNFKKF